MGGAYGGHFARTHTHVLGMSDDTTQRLLPLRCFNCGMPLNHWQVRYDDLLRGGVAPADAFVRLGIRRPCCRVIMETSPNDPRLRRRFKDAAGFAEVQYMPRSNKPYVLDTFGNTMPLDTPPAMKLLTLPP